jgi:23S rRNA pseudouridine1911/1915/1917 synthase
MTPVQTLQATPDDAGARLDAFLAQHAAAPSRAAAQRMLEAGRVAVDGIQRAKNHRMNGSETVSVEGEPAAPPAPPPQIAFEVVYEDDDLLVVDKPAGIVTHPAPGHDGPTLAEALTGVAKGGEDPDRIGIVHRLDRDTSGLLIVTKTEEAHAEMQRMMKAREVRREYLALVEGLPDADSGTIDAPIGRDRIRRTLQSTRTDNPREAVTHFEVLERHARTALLRVRLETGRTHQIRAHLTAIGHPVAGDVAYGGGKSGARLGLERQFLHADKLMFSHPMGRGQVTCESKPPEPLRRALDVARREPVSGGPDGG